MPFGIAVTYNLQAMASATGLVSLDSSTVATFAAKQLPWVGLQTKPRPVQTCVQNTLHKCHQLQSIKAEGKAPQDSSSRCAELVPKCWKAAPLHTTYWNHAATSKEGKSCKYLYTNKISQVAEWCTYASSVMPIDPKK